MASENHNPEKWRMCENKRLDEEAGRISQLE
jgi:hypothetical protein